MYTAVCIKKICPEPHITIRADDVVGARVLGGAPLQEALEVFNRAISELKLNSSPASLNSIGPDSLHAEKPGEIETHLIIMR